MSSAALVGWQYSLCSEHFIMGDSTDVLLIHRSAKHTSCMCTRVCVRAPVHSYRDCVSFPLTETIICPVHVHVCVFAYAARGNNLSACVVTFEKGLVYTETHNREQLPVQYTCTGSVCVPEPCHLLWHSVCP